FGQSISWNAKRVEIANAARHIPEIRRRSVNHSGTQTEYRLAVGTDLIRKCESRSERVWIVAVEPALARGFIDHRAGQVVHEWVRLFEIDALHPAVLLFKQCDEVITQTVLERQLASDFPTVLDVSRQGMVA